MSKYIVHVEYTWTLLAVERELTNPTCTIHVSKDLDGRMVIPYVST